MTCVQVVMGWILATHDGYGALRSCEHRHGVGVKNGVKRGSDRQSATLLSRNTFIYLLCSVLNCPDPIFLRTFKG